MQSQTITAGVFDTGGDSARNYRGWVLFAGITSLALGTAAVIYNGTATIASVVLFGWLLMLAGVMQIVHAFQVRTWSCLLYTSPSPRDRQKSRMPSSA